LGDNVWRTARVIRIEGQDPDYLNLIQFFDGGNITDWTYSITFNGLVPPQNFHTIGRTVNSISLAWNHTNPNVTTYKLQMLNYDQINSTYVVLQAYLVATQFTVTGLNQSTNYEFQVFASLNGDFEYVGATLIAATVNPSTSSTGTTGIVHTTGTTGATPPGSTPKPTTPKPTTSKPTPKPTTTSPTTTSPIALEVTASSPPSYLWVVFVIVFIILILAIVGVIIVVWILRKRRNSKEWMDKDLNIVDLEEVKAATQVLTNPKESTPTEEKK